MLPRFHTWNLDQQDEPVRFARRGVVTALGGWGLSDLRDTAELLVSELVTNAVRHGKPPVRLTLAIERERVEIRVSDGSPEPPLPRAGDEDGGFGLTVADALAEISVHTFPGGKQIRAALRGGPFRS
ncbi:ATP-binding protein [Actinocorallia longicatena]|uniref:Histidine kinase/HSP90-like ATPase domain-containing protein n=1 Tax=Actinocorallia longicatena TaxID=111803 RepID=A0ABP6Q055_9ACTN